MTRLPPPPPGSLWALPPTDPNVRASDVQRLTGQTRQVAEALLRGERISLSWAHARNIQRLAARIGDLRAEGWAIQTGRDPVTKCAVYWLEVGK